MRLPAISCCGALLRRSASPGAPGSATRDYDQTAVVTGNLGASLPVAGALAGGPAVGAALLLFSQVFKEPLKGITRGYYRITGPWDNPTVERVDASAIKVSEQQGRQYGKVIDLAMSVAAVIQMTSSPDVAANLATARGLLERARAQGAVLAALPENFAIMGRKEADKLEVAEAPGEGPIQAFLGHCARELGLWIVGGTIPIRRRAEPGRVAAACLVFDERGRCVARYDKIHLFDVDIPGREERYRESATDRARRAARGR